MNFASTLVECTGALAAPVSRSGSSLRRREKRSEKATAHSGSATGRRSVRGGLRGLRDRGLRRRRLRRDAWPTATPRSTAVPPFFCMSTLPRKWAPSAMATRGETMSPSTEPPSRMSTFSDAVTLPLTSPSTMTALANTCGLDPAVGTDRQQVVLQLDLALDVALDREVLTAAQLAFDDH